MARCSAEAEYRVMASATCELIWFKQLLKELKFGEVTKMTLICDNQAVAPKVTFIGTEDP